MTETTVPDGELADHELVIEQAVPDDAASISDLLRRTWLVTYPNAEAGITEEDIRLRTEGEHGERIPEKIAKWRATLEKNDPSQSISVARQNNVVVGMSLARMNASDGKRRIGAMYVSPDSQGQGIGGALMQQALDWLGTNEDIYLDVASYNQNAIEFYQSFGFVPTDTPVIDEGDIYGEVRIPEMEMVLRAKHRII